MGFFFLLISIKYHPSSYNVTITLYPVLARTNISYVILEACKFVDVAWGKAFVYLFLKVRQISKEYLGYEKWRFLFSHNFWHLLSIWQILIHLCEKLSGVARAFPGERVKMRNKISKTWGKVRKIDQNFRKKMRKVELLPSGTVRLTMALEKLRYIIIISDYKEPFGVVNNMKTVTKILQEWAPLEDEG